MTGCSYGYRYRRRRETRTRGQTWERIVRRRRRRGDGVLEAVHRTKVRKPEGGAVGGDRPQLPLGLLDVSLR